MILSCEGLANYCGLRCLEVPVSSGTRLRHSTRSLAAHVGSRGGGLRWDSEDWFKSAILSSEAIDGFSENVSVSNLEQKDGISSVHRDKVQDTEGIALYIDLPCAPCKDSAEFALIKFQEQLLAIGSEARKTGPASTTGPHEQPKMTSQAEVSQRSEGKLPSSVLGSHVLRAFLGETDNVNRFKRWRQVTAIDKNLESGACNYNMSENLPRWEMSASRVKEGLLERGRDVKVGVSEPDLIKDSGDQCRHSSEGECRCLVVEKTEAKIPPNLGTHALMALLEAEAVQKLKRRRLTTSADSAAVKDSEEISGRIPSECVSRGGSEPSNEPGDSKGSPLSPIPNPKSDLQALKGATQSSFAQNGAERASSGDCTSEMTSRKSDIQSDSSSEFKEHHSDKVTLDKDFPGPSEHFGGSADASGPKKKEWLGPHQGGKEVSGIAQDASFAGNVGDFYRSAIDKRPAAPHPGFVGDGATVQFCRICGEREDATSSLICDSCEEVFHMACINARMKIIPRVDEWLCRPCKKKRKMSRENDNQGDSDPGGDPKEWWREDSGVGRVERELLRMSNGRRMKVRLGSKYQAEIHEWTGIGDEIELDDNLAETSYGFGYEVPLTSEQKQLEQENAEYNLRNVLVHFVDCP